MSIAYSPVAALAALRLEADLDAALPPDFLEPPVKFIPVHRLQHHTSEVPSAL
jgi:hypothetical protein